MATTVNTTNNTVTITETKSSVNVTNNNTGAAVSITGTDVSTITVTAPGPKGDKGELGSVSNYEGTLSGDHISLSGDITASGDISASGMVYASQSIFGAGAGSSKDFDFYGTSYFHNEVFLSHFDVLTNNSRIRDNLTLYFGDNRQFGIKNNTVTDTLNIVSGSSTNLITINGKGNISASGTGSFGRVGIGTSSPANPLVVVGSDSVGIDDYILHNGDGNTKFGFPSNDTFKIRVADGDRLYIPSSGYVGIGTSTPEESLTVTGSIQLPNQRDITWSDVGDGNTGRVVIRGNEDNDTILFKTDNVERIRLTNTGLGMGTTSPSDKLHIISGSIILEGPSVEYVIKRVGYDEYQIRQSSGTGLELFNKTDTNVTMKLESGKVGIGTTAPGNILHLSSSTRTRLEVETCDSGSEAGITFNTLREGAGMGGSNLFKSGSQTYWFLDEGLYWNSNDRLWMYGNQTSTRFYSSSAANAQTTEYVRFDHENKRVGIGTSSPSAILDIEDSSGVTIDINSSTGDGKFRFQDNGATKWAFGRDNTTNNIEFASGSALGSADNVLTLTPTKRVGIGTTSPEYILDVQGVDPVFRIANSAGGNPESGSAIWMGENGPSEVRGGGIIYDGKVNTISIVTSDNGSSDMNNDPYKAVKRLTIQETDGNVGIGTTTPEKKLHVRNSGILINGGSAIESSPYTARLIVDTGASTGHTLAKFHSDSGSLMIKGNGEVSASSTGSFEYLVLDYDKIPSSDPSIKGAVYRNGSNQLFISPG